MSRGHTQYNSEHYYLILRAIQIASMTIFQIGIPVFFIAEYGLSGYGKWVLSLSFISFIGFFDFGFFNSVINDAISLRTLGRDGSAKNLLETLSKFTITISILLTLAILIFDAVVALSKGKHNLIAVLGLGAIVQTLIRLNEAVSRAFLDATGFAILIASYLIESIVLFMAIHLRLDFFTIAILLAWSRLLFAFFGFYVNRKYVSILDVMKLDLETMMTFWRQNLGKGLAFLALPLGNLILFDLTNIILGSVISKEFVAELSLMRISTGVIRQFSSAILTSYSPVLSQAIFSANAHVIRRLQRRIRFTLLVAISLISGLLLISSNLIFEHYFKETTLLSRPIFVLFAVSVVLDIPWNYRSTFLFAANLHEGIAKRFLLSSLLAIISVFFLAPAMGFYGVIISFCVQDVLLTKYAFKESGILLKSYELSSGVND